MKKFFKNLLLFFTYVIVLYFLFIILWGELMPPFARKNLNYSLGSYGHMHTRLQEVNNYKNIDILFTGSSHAYRGFDTRIAESYGYKTFNLGSSAQTPVQTKLLLERYLDQLQPKILVYEVYPHTFEIDGVESSLDIIANGKIDDKVVDMALTLNDIKTYNSLLYGFYRHTFNRDKNFNEKRIIEKDTYIPGGFIEREVEDNIDSTLNNVAKAIWTPRKYQIQAFETIVALIKEKGIKLVLVQSPVTKQAYNKYSNNDSIDRYFSGKGVYYNFNGVIKLSETIHFYNEDHLNQRGVQLFDMALMDSIGKK